MISFPLNQWANEFLLFTLHYMFVAVVGSAQKLLNHQVLTRIFYLEHRVGSVDYWVDPEPNLAKQLSYIYATLMLVR